MLFEPYLRGVGYDDNKFLIDQILNIPPEMMEYLQTFNEFKNCLREDDLDSDYYDRVFNEQILIDDDEYLHIIVTAYDEVFQLQSDIQKTVEMLKTRDWKQSALTKERFFHYCRHNWIEDRKKKYLYYGYFY
ncbi:hypothetical protein FGO68_gene2223 [Halteria grandinella]|uniref:Uncharacterized protein n=1 Tax=Halteria grandinella TaxID=5974 RepID=A0A8J8NX33_HALGN|nr:hypothetical protein FGO68_gene2223 [Halteria grandinella]